jgi:hypothetical protein
MLPDPLDRVADFAQIPGTVLDGNEIVAAESVSSPVIMRLMTAHGGWQPVLRSEQVNGPRLRRNSP